MLWNTAHDGKEVSGRSKGAGAGVGAIAFFFEYLDMNSNMTNSFSLSASEVEMVERGRAGVGDVGGLSNPRKTLREEKCIGGITRVRPDGHRVETEREVTSSESM